MAGARKKFSDGDKASAMTDLKIALHKLENPQGMRLPKLRAPLKPSLTREMVRAGWSDYLGSLHDFLEQCASRTNALMLGVDAVGYANFLNYGPAVQWAKSGSPIVQHRSTYNEVSSEHFEGLISFLIDYGIKASGAYVPVGPRN
jgi:hypothetical protein